MSAGEPSFEPAAVVSWRIVVAADRRAADIAYTVTNRGDEALFALDVMTAFGPDGDVRVDENAVIVDHDPETFEARFTRGYEVNPGTFVSVEVMPGVRTVAPRASIAGHARVPLPLREWFPYAGEAPFPKPPSFATLRVGMLPATVRVHEQPVQDGRTIRVPERADIAVYQRFVVSGPQPVPRLGGADVSAPS